MADIDLKTETPDTTLPTTGFLFGADSQAASAPSVFTTQAVATTLLGSTTLSGATITADAPVLNMSQTWNNAAVTFTGLKFNVPTDSSASGSLLMDLQVGGSTKFRVGKDGSISGNGNKFFDYVVYGGGVTTSRTGVSFASTGGFPNSGSSIEATITANGAALSLFSTAAKMRLGAADAAAPAAQTLSVQSVVAGTSNTAGANLTITGSQGTGTGAGGSIIFQVAPAGGSGTAQNALATALTINSNQTIKYEYSGTSVLPTIYWNTNPGVLGNWGFYSPATGVTSFATANAEIVRFGGPLNGLVVYEALGFGPTLSTPDVRLYRDAANTLALRNGANAQTFRVYNTYTDDSNYERAFLAWSANVFNVGTSALGTGGARAFALSSANEIRFQPNNTLSWTMSTSGHLLAGADNTYDIGASGANRPRNVYVAGSIAAGGAISVGSSNTVSWNAGGSYIFGNAATGSNSGTFRLVSSGGTPALNFGGDTSSFPALKRSTTTLQVRLADDSAFAPVQGKLTTDTAYAAGDPATTGYLVVYDSTGTAYKIPALAV